jgi:outer membrane protein OmpA-like peptidoglycan-associated protein
MIRHPEENLNVRGYTDSSGPPSYNESVSRFRANAVKSYLVGKGVNADRISTWAMGGYAPMASNETLEGRRLNRRVEIEFLNPTKARKEGYP